MWLCLWYDLLLPRQDQPSVHCGGNCTVSQVWSPLWMDIAQIFQKQCTCGSLIVLCFRPLLTGRMTSWDFGIPFISCSVKLSTYCSVKVVQVGTSMLPDGEARDTCQNIHAAEKASDTSPWLNMENLSVSSFANKSTTSTLISQKKRIKC